MGNFNHSTSFAVYGSKNGCDNKEWTRVIKFY